MDRQRGVTISGDVVTIAATPAFAAPFDPVVEAPLDPGRTSRVAGVVTTFVR
jgi:hypothetical protein